ncbi:MAG: hypothetical protein GY835_26320 [bacterium]|nr:hypothetical protein [bacterium]
MSDQGPKELVKSTGLFDGAWNLILFAVVALLWFCGVKYETDITALIAVAIFLAWDLSYFIWSMKTSTTRHFDNLTDQTTSAKSHISYFLPFYGVLFGILFTSDPERILSFTRMLSDSGVNMWLFSLPLAIASLGLFFIPIQSYLIQDDLIQDEKKEKKGTTALRVIFVVSAFCQKTSIFLLIHTTMRLISKTALI